MQKNHNIFDCYIAKNKNVVFEPQIKMVNQLKRLKIEKTLALIII